VATLVGGATGSEAPLEHAASAIVVSATVTMDRELIGMDGGMAVQFLSFELAVS